MSHFQHLGGGGVILLRLSEARERRGRKCDTGSGVTRGVAGEGNGIPSL